MPNTNQEKWRKENRNYRSAFWERYLADSLKTQVRLENRIKTIRQILTMRRQNKLTLRQIGKEVGMSGQAISQFLQKFNVN